MDIKFNTLKATFNGIKNIREEINSIFAKLDSKVVKLKDMYKDFVEHNSTKLFIFGLDSFYFQNKMIDNEFSDMKKFYELIMNRMYYEYYSLHKIIMEYVINTLADDEKLIAMIRNKPDYPKYKVLEPYKYYDFSLIAELHDDITNLLFAMNNYLSNKKHILTIYQLRSDVGLNINNFVSTYEFKVASIEGQIELFCRYIDFFHELHLKYMHRFAMKIQIIYRQVNRDINLDEVSLTNKSDKKQHMNNNMKHEIDKKTFNELRTSIHIDQHPAEIFYDGDDLSTDKDIIDFNNHIKIINDISKRIETNKSLSVNDRSFMSMSLRNIRSHSTSIINDDLSEHVEEEHVEEEHVEEEHVEEEHVEEDHVEEDHVEEEHVVEDHVEEEHVVEEQVEEEHVVEEQVEEEHVEEEQVEEEHVVNNIHIETVEVMPNTQNNDDWFEDFVQVNNKKKKSNKKNKKKK